MPEDTETFDLSELKEGDLFFEEIYEEDDDGNETVLVKKTLEIPKLPSDPSAMNAEPVAPIVQKIEYFSDDFELLSKSADVSVQYHEDIWKVVSPVGNWIWNNRKELADIIKSGGEPMKEEDLSFEKGLAGVQAKHAKPQDYFASTSLKSQGVGIRVRNNNGTMGADIKNIRMYAFLETTNKAKDDASGGVPGVYIKKAYILAGSIYRGWGNFLKGHSQVLHVGNANKDGPDKFDTHMALKATFHYGHWSWQQRTTVTFECRKASQKAIYHHKG